MCINCAFLFLSSPFVSPLLLSVSTLYCHPFAFLFFSPGKESVAVKSTFQKFQLLFANNSNILFIKKKKYFPAPVSW